MRFLGAPRYVGDFGMTASRSLSESGFDAWAPLTSYDLQSVAILEMCITLTNSVGFSDGSQVCGKKISNFDYVTNCIWHFKLG